MVNKVIRPDTKETYLAALKEPEYCLGILIALYKEQLIYKDQWTVLNTIYHYFQKNKQITDHQIRTLQKYLIDYQQDFKYRAIIPFPINFNPIKKPNRVQKKIVYKKENKLEIHFPFPDSNTLTEIKKLVGRKYSGREFWTAPIYIENLQRLKNLDFEFDFDVDSLIWPFTKIKEIKEIEGIPEAMPFQLQGVEFLESRNGRALIADDMGLGKTLQALIYLKLHPELRPAVIVCPASLKYNWRNEIKRWLSESTTILQGKITHNLENPNIIIINYDILNEWLPMIEKTKPQICIIDEIHYTKNSKAIRTKTVKKLSKKCPHFIGLTGTPIVNKPIEFFNVLNMIDPKRWPSYWEYAHEFCNPKHNGFGWTFNGTSNTEKLHRLIQANMIRRKKEEVLKQLPPKIRTVIPIELSNQEEYAKVEQEIKEEIQQAKANKEPTTAYLTRFEKLKQAAVKGKLKQIISWIEDYLESDNKLVIFTTHHQTIDFLMSELKKYKPVGIDGRTAINKRQPIVEAFQTDPKTRLFIGNIKAAGIGLTLTAAPATCFVELGWTPGEHEQAEDRIHRIGQESSSVHAYYLLAEDTIEMEIAELLDSKRKVLDAVLDGKETDESSLLTKLIQRYQG